MKHDPKRWCRQPDRDVPSIECGYPLPCPHHTAVIDVSNPATTVTIPLTAHGAARARKRLLDIGRAVKK
jgi:hypothetical protein